MAHWQLPRPPSRGMRLIVFAAVVVVIAVSIIALLYTALLTSTPTQHGPPQTTAGSTAAFAAEFSQPTRVLSERVRSTAVPRWPR